MPSPIAHSLAGIAVARLLLPAGVAHPVRWYAVALFAANAADLDVVAGAIAGSINAYHGGLTHSIAGVFVVAAACAIPASRSLGGRARVAAVAFAAAATHVVLDLLTGPEVRPGLPLLWPFTEEDWMFPWLPFGGIQHGALEAGLDGFMDELISMENLRAVFIEFAVLAPPAALAWVATRGRAATRDRAAASE